MADSKKDKKGSSGGNSPEPVITPATEPAIETTDVIVEPEIIAEVSEIEPEVESVSPAEQPPVVSSEQPTPPEVPEQPAVSVAVEEPAAASVTENVRYVIGDVVHHPVYGRCLVRNVESDGFYHVDSDRYPSQIKVIL